MLQKGVEFTERDMSKQPLSKAEIEALIGGRDVAEFLNPRNELYRKRKMKEKPPSRAEAIALMLKEPNLIRRPILELGGKLVMGFDPAAYGKIR